jgi:centromere protein I
MSSAGGDDLSGLIGDLEEGKHMFLTGPQKKIKIRNEKRKPKARKREKHKIADIQVASKVPAKRRGTSIKSTVESTTSLLYDRGALPDELVRLVDLLTVRNHLDQASLGAIVRNLYPSGKVGDEVVLRCVGALGHGQLKPSLPLQALLLRWLVMIYHLLENPTILSQSYGVLFNLLDTAAIR